MYQMGPDQTSSFLISFGIRLISVWRCFVLSLVQRRLVGQWRRTAASHPCLFRAGMGIDSAGHALQRWCNGMASATLQVELLAAVSARTGRI